nr:MAG TPA: hypothetical protein [Caudoviricetes sp.]DAX42039.1 MAG TPA: hypothetical protein [Caudoviricetes sp.]DAX82724.1 MAG TPA: hypothetical protein [Caudoviricetes sp.]
MILIISYEAGKNKFGLKHKINDKGGNIFE